jgi:hypothetical protein
LLAAAIQAGLSQLPILAARPRSNGLCAGKASGRTLPLPPSGPYEGIQKMGIEIVDGRQFFERLHVLNHAERMLMPT